MPNTSEAVKVPAIHSVLALVLFTSAAWILRGYIWPIMSNVEVDALRAMLDPSLFQRDFAVQECMNFTPRYYFNTLILLPARAGVPLEWVFALYHLLALGILLSGIRALARSIGLGEIASAILILWLLYVGIGTLGGVFFYTPAPVPAVWAAAGVAWGAAWAWRGRWLAAFACFGVAVLLQFLVGFYAGMLALPALLWSQRRQSLPLIIPWLLGLALVYVPMILAGSTGGATLNNESFVHIYAQLRLPHHLIPSTWGWPYWVQAIGFYVGAGWFIHRTRSGRPPTEEAFMLGSIGLATGALMLNYLFVEIHPLALIAKLQPARVTPLTQGVVLILLATRVHAKFIQRDWLGGILLCLIPFSAFPGALLVLAAVLVPVNGLKPPPSWSKYVLAFAVLLAFQPFSPSFAIRSARYALWIAIPATQLIAFSLVGRPRILASLTLMVSAGTATFAYASQAAAWPSNFASHFSINASPTDPPGIIGLRFAQHSSKDALVLVPPTAEVWTFKLYASRSVVVDDKSTPFTDRGLRDWRDRMEQVLGTKYVPGIDAAAAWRSQSVASLVITAKKYGAQYVLTKDAVHLNFPGIVIDRERDWTLWQISGPELSSNPDSK